MSNKTTLNDLNKRFIIPLLFAIITFNLAFLAVWNVLGEPTSRQITLGLIANFSCSICLATSISSMKRTAKENAPVSQDVVGENKVNDC